MILVVGMLIDSIPVYQVQADFVTSPEGEMCAPADVVFQSLNNNYIEVYDWSTLE